jgi:lactoylglutathione lyase
MIKGFAHLALNVKDMEKSLEFYNKVFGFTKAFSLANEKGEPWIEYVKVGKGKFIELFYNNDAPNSGSFNHICFEIDDCQAMAQKILDAGEKLTTPPKIGVDGNWQCWTVDPDGNKIELMQYAENAMQLQY